MNRWATLNDGYGNEIHLTTGTDAAIGHILLTKLDGFYGGSEFRLERTSRLGDGLFNSGTNRNGRKLTLAGVASFATGEETEAFARMLSGLFLSDSHYHIEKQSGWLEAENSNGILRAHRVEPDGEIKIQTQIVQCWVRFEIPLLCPDPYLYGPLQQTMAFTAGAGGGLEYVLFDDETATTTGVLEFGAGAVEGAASLVNTGNAVAYPVVEVVGDFPSGFELRFSGDGPSRWGVTWAGMLSRQEPAWVDMSGSVSVGKLDQSRYLTERFWGGVRPGGQVTVSVFANSGGSGSARLTLLPAYS